MVVKRARDVELAMSWSIVRTSTIGRSGSIERTTAAIGWWTASGSPAVRTAIQFRAHVLCANGTWISGRLSLAGPRLRTSPETPTICRSMPGPRFVTPGLNCSMTTRCVSGSTSGK